MTNEKYNRHGARNRKEYLDNLGDMYGNSDAVYAIADVLGEGEDFDGLLAMLDDFEYIGWL